ncbi:MAG: hypothetical protein HGA80_00965 [Candidatus Omnitrophica bacterium]|nr:hypothetical protein [Candidatus Omnitrophota bacterium]
MLRFGYCQRASFTIQAIVVLLLVQEAGPVFSDDAAARPAAIEVIVRGKIFSSVDEYANARLKKAALAIERRGVPWAAQSGVSLPESLLPVGHSGGPVVETVPDMLQGLSGGIEDSGWKTVWLDNKGHPRENGKSSATRTAVGALESGASVVPAGADISGDDVAVVRVLGVSPSMSTLVKDFEKVTAVKGAGADVIKFNTEDELGEYLRSQASGQEGPLLILSSHNRIRLMGLKPASTVDLGK